MSEDETKKGTKKEPVCSICGKPVDPAFTPFCSKRCANVDLHRWLNGSYSIAGEPIDDEHAPEPREEDV
jgi:endogenous inhibitor of DNA gyrase (YacG/DUF329 family)